MQTFSETRRTLFFKLFVGYPTLHSHLLRDLTDVCDMPVLMVLAEFICTVLHCVGCIVNGLDCNNLLLNVSLCEHILPVHETVAFQLVDECPYNSQMVWLCKAVSSTDNIHCVSKNDAHQPIFGNFGRDVAERILNGDLFSHLT